jgi:hypothetical protein
VFFVFTSVFEKDGNLSLYVGSFFSATDLAVASLGDAEDPDKNTFGPLDFKLLKRLLPLSADLKRFMLYYEVFT